jgi:hypothetical protein
MVRIYLKDLRTKFSGLLTRVKSNLSKSLKKNTIPKASDYYEAIDELPLHNWIKCTSNELTYVRRDKNGTEEEDIEAWQRIYDSYISEYGLSDMYKKLLNAMKKKALLEVDYIVTRERFKLTEIEMQIANLDAMLNNKGSGVTIEQSLIHLSKWLGSWINVKAITTKEYFNLIEEYGKENKRK